MSWSRLRQELLESYPTATDDGPNGLRLVLTASGGLATRVGLRIHVGMAYGEAIVVTAADLGPASFHDPAEVLATNAILANGALAVRGTLLELRAVSALGFGFASFELALRRLAAEAAELKARWSMPRTAGHLTAFAHLAD